MAGTKDTHRKAVGIGSILHKVHTNQLAKFDELIEKWLYETKKLANKHAHKAFGDWVTKALENGSGIATGGLTRPLKPHHSLTAWTMGV